MLGGWGHAPGMIGCVSRRRATDMRASCVETPVLALFPQRAPGGETGTGWISRLRRGRRSPRGGGGGGRSRIQDT